MAPRGWIYLAAGILAGCTAGGQLATEGPAADAAAVPSGNTSTYGTPLIIDRTDLRLGTTAQFSRIPTIAELHDLRLLPAVSQVVLSLPSWPADVGVLDPLRQIEQGIGLVVVLPGYPPSRPAAEAWNTLSVPTRIIVIVSGPPPGVAAVEDLNMIRRLERVIAQMDEPSRTGFERLQWPLSFRKVID